MIDLENFDNIPKFHMLSHYVLSIRELGTPDGYNTESPEHLHIVYAKRAWRASNRREAIRQIIKYVQRLEAIRIQRAYMDEFYGESPRLKLPAGQTEGDDDDDRDDNDDDDVDDDDEDDEEAGVHEEMEADSDSSDVIAYPRPTLSVAVQPTKARRTGHHLVSTYGTTDLIRSLDRFLKPLARDTGVAPRIFLADTFDVWHKLTIHHRSIRFAPDEHLHQDVVRIRPPSTDAHGYRVPGLFDTALFLNRPQAVGLQRYRAGRVRAIFTLPSRLQTLYPGRLAYVELFTSFKSSVSPTHGMHAVSHDLKNGQRRAMVIPVEQVTMACHLGPRFAHVSADVQRHTQVDMLSLSRHFHLNPFYNSFLNLYLRYWKHLEAL
ncbi:hypothetical protein FRC12_000059 [Ceratobasidium sp. 428]|nr:hypothetical protein FRC12_000059 [Ceratobasidium sp. 428]